MMQHNGKIQSVKINPKNYIIEVDGVKFSIYGKPKFETGDLVEFDYEVKGDYKNIKRIALMSPKEVLTNIIPKKDIGFEIRLGQAQKQALNKQLTEMSETKRAFNWEQYKKDSKEFFKINQQIGDEL